jgi:ABC-type antimicrobial peptide transport system permease subunit
MRLFDYLTIALRNILRQKLRSALTIFAVVIGATSVTIMLALVFGAKGFFIKQLESTGALQQVAVSSKQDITDFNDAQHGGSGNCDTCVKLTEPLVTKIKAIPHVDGVARQTYVGNFESLLYGSKKLTLNNIQSGDANGIVKYNILAGRDLNESDKENVVVITSDYADKLGFKGNYKGFIGKEIKLQSRGFYSGIGATITNPADQQQNNQNGPGSNPQQPQSNPVELPAKVVGIMDTLDQSAVVRVPLDWARGMNLMQRYEMTPADQKANQDAQNACQLSHKPCNTTQHFSLVKEDTLATNGYNALIVKVDNSQNAAGVATAIRKFGVGAADAETQLKSQLQIFNIMGLVLGGIGGIALAVAAIGVVNTMVMSILERTREIGVMRAVGAKRSTVSLLFTFEASLLGFWGGVFGVAAGYGLTRIANVFINKQLASQSLSVRDIIGLPLWLMAAVVGIATLIGLLAGLYPARRAAKLNPVDALHYE